MLTIVEGFRRDEARYAGLDITQIMEMEITWREV